MTKESVDEESRLLVGVSGDNVKSDQFILTSFPRFPSSDQPHGAKIYTIIVVTIVGLLCVCTSYISYASTAMSEKPIEMEEKINGSSIQTRLFNGNVVDPHGKTRVTMSVLCSVI